jgi:hypothetical protein
MDGLENLFSQWRPPAPPWPVPALDLMVQALRIVPRRRAAFATLRLTKYAFL